MRRSLALAFCLMGCAHAEVSETPRAQPLQVAWVPGQEDSGPNCRPDDPREECQPEEEEVAEVELRSDDVKSGPRRRKAPPPPPEPDPCEEAAVRPRLVSIPAGNVTMGCSIQSDPECGRLERPPRLVELPAYSIDATEVTQAAYERCVVEKGCSLPSEAFEPRLHCLAPVVSVSWHQAREFCEWRGARLPTEVEWERAARADDGRRFPWGDEAPTCARANFRGCGSAAKDVGESPDGASPYGVLDLAGNVREWLADQGERASQRAIRGGMFNDPAVAVRAARRSWGDVQATDPGVGFRCVSDAI